MLKSASEMPKGLLFIISNDSFVCVFVSLLSNLVKEKEHSYENVLHKQVLCQTDVNAGFWHTLVLTAH